MYSPVLNTFPFCQKSSFPTCCFNKTWQEALWTVVLHSGMLGCLQKWIFHQPLLPKARRQRLGSKPLPWPHLAQENSPHPWSPADAGRHCRHCTDMSRMHSPDVLAPNSYEGAPAVLQAQSSPKPPKLHHGTTEYFWYTEKIFLLAEEIVTNKGSSQTYPL